MLGVGIIDINAIQAEMEAVEQRNREVAQEVQQNMGLVLTIENVPIREFCERSSTLLSVFEQQMDPPMNSDLVLVFAKERTVQTPLLFTNSHVMPFVSDAVIGVEIRSDTGRLMDGGILIDQYKEPYGIFSYLPYSAGKKIYGFYKRTTCGRNHKDIRQYFTVGECKEGDPIPSIQIPEMQARNLDDNLTEVDKMLAANSSPRFRKLSEGWSYLGEALHDLNGLMRRTIDPNYIEKIMFLNNQMSYPAFSRDDGQ